MASTNAKWQYRDGWWLALLVCIGLALRATVIASYSHTIESDELAYRSMASNLLGGKGVVDNMGNYAMYNVGYPLFVLAPTFFAFGDSILAARIFNAVLGGLSITLCYALASAAGAGRVGKLLAAGIWALYLPASIYSVYLLKENLMVPLILAVMWCALRFQKAPSGWLAAGCGLLFGMIALSGNAALSMVAAVMIAVLLAPMSIRQRLGHAALILLVASAVVAPWMIRNMHAIGAPVLNTNSGFNLYLGNNPAATGMFVSIKDTPRGESWESLRKTGEVLASETLKNEAITWITENPSTFVSLALKKAAYFWTPPLHEGKGKQSTAEKAVRLMWVLQFLALAAAALGSLTMTRLRNQQLLILWLAITGYTAVHMLFYVIFRYREPIMPIVGIIAALVLESLIVRWRERTPSP